MRAFILTLENRAARLANAVKMQRALEVADYHADIHFCLDAAHTRLDTFRVDPSAKRHLTETFLQAGDICCYHSHISIARKMVAMDLPWCHVFEDDAFLAGGTMAGGRLRALDMHLEGDDMTSALRFGIITLHVEAVEWAPDEVLSDADPLLVEVRRKPMLMHGYTISRAVAEALLALSEQRGNWDVISGDVAQELGLPCYRVKEAVCGLATELACESFRCNNQG